MRKRTYPRIEVARVSLDHEYDVVLETEAKLLEKRIVDAEAECCRFA